MPASGAPLRFLIAAPVEPSLFVLLFIVFLSRPEKKKKTMLRRAQPDRRLPWRRVADGTDGVCEESLNSEELFVRPATSLPERRGPTSCSLSRWEGPSGNGNNTYIKKDPPLWPNWLCCRGNVLYN